MPDPVTMAIATAAASKVTESVTEQAREVIAQLAQRIRARFRHQPDHLAVLDAAEARPGSPDLIARLASLLDEAAAQDPAFGTELRGLWDRAQAGLTAGGTTNIFTGHAAKVVQARDIHGGLTIN